MHRSWRDGDKSQWELNITEKVRSLKVCPTAGVYLRATINSRQTLQIYRSLTLSTYKYIPYLLQKGSEKPLESFAGKFLAPFNWICSLPPDFFFFFLSLLDSSPGSYISDTVKSPQYDIRDGSGRCGNRGNKRCFTFRMVFNRVSLNQNQSNCASQSQRTQTIQ